MREQRVTSDSTALGFDLFSLLTYMSALASARLSKESLLENTIRQDNQLVFYFRQVLVLAKKDGNRIFTVLYSRGTHS